MTANELRPAWVEEAWTATDLATHTGMSVEAAEMALDSAVAGGVVTRVSCGLTTAYLPGSVRLTSDDRGDR